MKLQTLHENTGFSFKGMSSVVSDETIAKAEEAFSLAMKGMKQIGDRSFDDKWEGNFTDGLSELKMVIWKASNDRIYLSYQIDTLVEIVDFLNHDDDASTKYFTLATSFVNEDNVLDYLVDAPKVLFEQIHRFAEWYFDMSGEHGKLKLIKKGDITSGVTFYAVGGKIETYQGAGNPEKPEVY